MIVRPYLIALALAASITNGADQSTIQYTTGPGNATAEQTGHKSPLIQSALDSLEAHVRQIANEKLRASTLDAVVNPDTCVAHRANLTPALKAQIIDTLIAQNLVNPSDAEKIPGGIAAGIFPALRDDGGACPHLALDFYGAPGGATGSHHSYPGGLSVHEAFNQQSALNVAASYRAGYGQVNERGLPIARNAASTGADPLIEHDAILAAPAWHDWAKTMVMQWNADGSIFPEMSFGGSGKNDNYGTPGDSRTGAHHILGLAEAMARGLPPLVVITQASAHSAPTLGNEFKVANWLRAAAVVARIDPVAKGYLLPDSKGNLRLPPLKHLADLSLWSHGQANLLIEYSIHNLSDADFANSIPAVAISETVLQTLAPEFGFNAADLAAYNTKYRNVVLSFEGGERLEMLYAQSGVAGIRTELTKLRKLGFI